ncbi:forkhead box protein J1-B [Lates japonicus]|uniref:Forkhead box protein J1-B n=1 Tax=Lates japonicus TaxID=270547 RepID=A0AAD3NMW6_LATJO|nr:forkhead box protein J1-B [Lates japonicus]
METRVTPDYRATKALFWATSSVGNPKPSDNSISPNIPQQECFEGPRQKAQAVGLLWQIDPQYAGFAQAVQPSQAQEDVCSPHTTTAAAQAAVAHRQNKLVQGYPGTEMAAACRAHKADILRDFDLASVLMASSAGNCLAPSRIWTCCTRLLGCEMEEFSCRALGSREEWCGEGTSWVRQHLSQHQSLSYMDLASRWSLGGQHETPVHLAAAASTAAAADQDQLLTATTTTITCSSFIGPCGCSRAEEAVLQPWEEIKEERRQFLLLWIRALAQWGFFTENAAVGGEWRPICDTDPDLVTPKHL